MLQVGFIGAGGYGRVQIDGFLNLQEQGLIKITALADPSSAILKELCQLPELKTAQCFSNYRDLLAIEELDAVVICAPIPLHEEMALAALARDIYILLEKPPVPILSQLERLIAADVHRRVMVGFQHVYSDSVLNLKRDLVAGHIGRILSISAHGVWPRPTSYYHRSKWAGQLAWRGQVVLDGPCTNAFAHFVNIVLYLAGEKEDTFAMPEQLTGEAYRARLGLPTYDTGCLCGALENDIRFFIGFSHAASDLLPVEIHIQGKGGRLSLLEDYGTLPSKGGRLIRWDEGRENLRRAFVAFAGGDASQNRTPLRAMRAYLLATNLMLLSSAGIHQVPDKYVRSITTDKEDAFFSVEKITDFLAQGAGQSSPLCQTSAPWAQKTKSLLLSEFSEAELIEILHLPASVTE